MLELTLSKMLEIYKSDNLSDDSRNFYRISGETIFSNIKFIGTIDETDENELLIENVSFRNCNFVNCKLLGEIKFNNCKFSGCVFRASFIDDCSFMNCDISSLDFVFTITNDLSVINFDNCNLNNVHVIHSKLLFILTKSKLSDFTIDFSILDVILKKQASMIDMSIKFSKLDLLFKEKHCELKDIDIERSAVHIGSDIMRFKKDEIDINNVRLTSSDIQYLYLIVDDKRIEELIYCYDCSCYNTTLKSTPVNVGPIGSRGDFTTYFPDKDIVKCGCWEISNKLPTGTLREFESRVNKVYGENGKSPDKPCYSQYMNAITYFKLERDRYLESLK